MQATEDVFDFMLNLTSLYGFEIIKHEIDGEEMDCVCFPVYHNGVRVYHSKYNKSVMMYGKCLPKKGHDIKDISHFITLQRPRDATNEMFRRGLSKYPIIGNLKFCDFRFIRNKSPQTALDNLDNIINNK